LKDRVSEHERLYISEKYYNYVTGEIDKSVEVLQTWTRLYPNDYIPHNNLSLNYQFLGRYDDARKEALEAVRLSPNTTSPRDNLISSFLALDRFDEATQAAEELSRLHPDYPGNSFNAYILAFLRGDRATMEREAQKAKGKPNESDAINLVAATAIAEGQLKKGEELTRRAVEMFKSQDRKENAAQTLITLALRQALFGRCPEARETTKAGLALAGGRVTTPGAALVYGYCNDGQSQTLLDGVIKLYPKDTPNVSMLAPVVKALQEMNRGNISQAIQVMESVRQYDLGAITGVTNNYLRGSLYLQQRSGAEAALEFQKILDHRGIDIQSPLHQLAHLGMARAAALSGDTAKSRKEYQDFFALWKDADADLPLLVQAKKEYEQVK
jgi:tetratricopeptide (TPR) repeat protein